MGRFLVIIMTMITLSSYAQNNEALWERANHLYTTGDFAGASSVYDSIVESGHTSSKLYYNLANAYFKQSNVGKAILYYNKALRLDPSNEDVQHNLKVAQNYTKDRIESVPEFVVKRWVKEFKNSTTSNTWAIVSILFLAVALSFTVIYLISSNIRMRKIGFWGGVACALIFVFAVIFSALEHPDEAIIMQSAVPVKSAPENGSKDIFVLHEGTKVRVTDNFGEWYEVVTADGNKGWAIAASMELID